jgi:hypothetical protein
VWADTLFRAEQQHLLRLLLWAATSILGGTALGVTTVVRRVKSPLLTNFAIQTGAWGVLIGGIAGVWWQTVALRDLAGAARLERMLWMTMGLDIGFIAVGVVLAITAWILSRRLGGVGAGTAIAIQGLALLVLDMQFANTVSR